MKFKKIIISILVMIAIISINSEIYAKYVFEYTLEVAKITINN